MRVSKSIRLLPRTPVYEAADWVEYTLAQGNLQYLRPRAVDMPFYELYLIDIVLVLLLFLVGVFTIIKLVITRFFRRDLGCNNNTVRTNYDNKKKKSL